MNRSTHHSAAPGLPAGRRPVRLPAMAALALAALLAVGTPPASAQTPAAPVAIDIPAQPLADALRLLARQASTQLFFAPELVAGKTAPAVSGMLTARQALERVLAGSGLMAVAEGGAAVVRPAPPAVAAAESVLPAVTVRAGADALPGELPKPYAGGQVARGGAVGLLGNQDFMETPFSVSSYTEQAIRDSQAQRIADVVARDASVLSGQQVYGASETLFVRGFSVNTDGSFSLDGLRGLASHRTAPLEMVERVELIKGPSALLTGNVGEVGGAVNLVTKRAADQPLTRLTTSYASDSLLGGHFDLGRRFGEDNQFGIRANLSRKVGDTYTDGQRLDEQLGSLVLDYRGQRLRAFAHVLHFDRKIDGVQDALFAPSDGGPVPRVPGPRSAFSGTTNLDDQSNRTVHGQIEYDLTDDTTVSVSHGRLRIEQDERFGLAFFDILNSAGDARGISIDAKTRSHRTSTAARLTSRFETGPVKHRVSLAYNRTRTQQEFGVLLGDTFDTNIYAPTFSPQPEGSSIAIRNRDNDDVGYGIANTSSFADERLLVTLGARHQTVKVTRYGPDGSVTTPAYDESRVTPAVGVLYKLSATTSLYANYIEALEEGPIAPTTGVTNPEEAFAPIHSRQREMGAKFDLGKLAVTVALFEIKQPSAFTDTATRRFALNGEQRNRGLEVNVFGAPVSGLRLTGGVALIDAELTKTADGTDDGRTAVGVAERLFKLNGEYDIAAVQGLTLTGRVLAASSQFVNQSNGSSIPGYGIVDLGLRYRLKAPRPVVVSLTVSNIADKRYYAEASFGNLSIGAPRTALLSAAVDF